MIRLLHIAAVVAFLSSSDAFGKVIPVPPGTDVMREALAISADGDTLLLEAGGVYHETYKLATPPHRVVIKAGDGDRARITVVGTRIFDAGGDLVLVNLHLDGRHEVSYGVRAASEGRIDISIQNCEFSNFLKDGITDDDVQLGVVTVRNSIFHHIWGVALEFRSPDTVDTLEVEHSTFYEVGEHAIHVTEHDLASRVRVSRVTVHNGLGGIYLHGVSEAVIDRSLFTGNRTYAIRYVGQEGRAPLIRESASYGNARDFELRGDEFPMSYRSDPVYFDPDNGDFSLLPSSPYLDVGGEAIGDGRWVGEATRNAYTAWVGRQIARWGAGLGFVLGVSLLAILVTRVVVRRRERSRSDQHVRAELEMRVEARTEDLLSINRQLKTEVERHEQTESALRESEERFRQLVELSPDIISVHQDDRIVFINTPGALRLGAKDPEEIIGMSAWDLMHPDYIRPIKRVLRKITLFRRPPIAEVKLVGLKGEVVDVEISAVPFTYRGRPAIQVMSRDITERLKAENARQQAETALETQRTQTLRSDRLRSLGEMAAGIAHELNQPLVAIRGAAEHTLIAMEEGWDASVERVRRRCNQIVGQADRMVHIIEHVRMFAREAGSVEVSQVQMNEVVTSTVDLLGTQFKSHDVDLSSDLEAGLPLVEANPYSLEEVLMNLIRNARDAAEERSDRTERASVRVRTSSDRVGEETVVVVEVVDNGDGIPDEIRSRIWEPFYTTKDPDKGTGLGLSIARSIVEEFAGSLDLSRNGESGTVARVVLPTIQLDPEVEPEAEFEREKAETAD